MAWGLSAALGVALAAIGSGCAGSQPLATVPTPGGATGSPRAVTSGTPTATPTPTPEAPTTPPPAAPSSWTLVSSPNAPGSANSQLNAVTCVEAGDCWAVGNAGDSDGGPVTNGATLIEQDTGAGWSIVSSPNPPGDTDSRLLAVTCVSADDCWAVGYSTDADLDNYTLIEQDAGSGWTIVSSPTPSGGGQLNGVSCAGAGDCWAVGYTTDTNLNEQTLIEQDTGSGWSVVPSPHPSGNTSSQLNAVTCVGAADCWAAGYSGINGNNPLTLIEQDTGGGWSIVPSPNGPDSDAPSALDGVSCAGAGDCWAVGTYGADNAWHALIEQDTGGGWSVVSSPTVSISTGGWLDALSAVTCVTAGDCWAAGLLESGLTESGSANQFTLIEQWTGGGWSIASTPDPAGGMSIALSGVTCPSEDDCWAVGSYQAGNDVQTLIEQAQ
ncbi:MAG: hypothetical protein ACLQGJ_02825 [Candidatus Dormibacteria bacterium]